MHIYMYTGIQRGVCGCAGCSCARRRLSLALAHAASAFASMASSEAPAAKVRGRAAAARAAVHSTSRSAFAAKCTATRADEQAVSMLATGPCKPRQKESLPAAMEMVPPVAAYTESSAA